MAKMNGTFRSKSQMTLIWNKLKKNKAAMVGLMFFALLLLVAIFADVIANYNTEVIKQNVSIRMQTPSLEHLFGTDAYGRDIFARIVHGSRISLMVGFAAVFVSMVVGSLIGSIAAYYGGKMDNILMRIMDVFQAIPPILLAIAIVSALGTGLLNLMIAMSISFIPFFARIIRSTILTVKESEYIEAAKACGTADARIILKHILPNAIGPIIVQATLSIGQMIIGLAALSFIGLGIEPPRPEWGAMLSEARKYMRYYPHLILFPGLAIVTTVLSFNLLGDGLRDALDPRLKN